jgi:DNA mismatch repair ATPase MutS
MLAAIGAEAFDAPLLATLRARGAEATREMARLGRILSFLDARNNEVFRIFIAPVLLWDLNCAIALESWRARSGRHVRAWLDTLAEVEATASLAGFAYERPDHAFPELEEAPRFSARALAHPLIAHAKRVANDVDITGPGRALVVTGSNMSGKSTLLRAIGAACVLARAGAPVCAESLKLGRVRVATSMRVRDSIEEGVSRFYAELKKLKAVLDSARAAPTVFLLDEILHGTNSRERLIGARAILQELLARGALGAVSTHDLALGDLEGETVQNVHFQEQVAGEVMTFDYRLRPGVVQSSNALRLMRIVGLDVV